MRRNVMDKVSVCDNYKVKEPDHSTDECQKTVMETMQYIQELVGKGKGNPKCKIYKKPPFPESMKDSGSYNEGSRVQMVFSTNTQQKYQRLLQLVLEDWLNF